MLRFIGLCTVIYLIFHIPFLTGLLLSLLSFVLSIVSFIFLTFVYSLEMCLTFLLNTV